MKTNKEKFVILDSFEGIDEVEKNFVGKKALIVDVKGALAKVKIGYNFLIWPISAIRRR